MTTQPPVHHEPGLVEEALHTADAEEAAADREQSAEEAAWRAQGEAYRTTAAQLINRVIGTHVSPAELTLTEATLDEFDPIISRKVWCASVNIEGVAVCAESHIPGTVLANNEPVGSPEEFREILGRMLRAREHDANP